MANEDMKDVVRNQEFADPKTGKRKVVLGEEDYSDPVTPRTSPHKPESMIDLETDPGYSGKSADTESGGFFRKFLKLLKFCRFQKLARVVENLHFFVQKC